MTNHPPSHSPADEDSDFLWQSTCGSDISPCLAEPEPAEPEAIRPSRDSNRLIRGDSLEDVDDSQALDSFGLDGVDLPSSTTEAHAIVGRRARWRGAEIYTGPTPAGDTAVNPAGETGVNPTASPIPAGPAIPPLVPLVGTMLAAAIAFVILVLLPGRFDAPVVAPSDSGPQVVTPVPSDPSPTPAANPEVPAVEASKPETNEVAGSAEPPMQRPIAEPPVAPSIALPIERSAVEPTQPPVVGPPAIAVPPKAEIPPPTPPKVNVAPTPPPAAPLPEFSGARAETLLSMARQIEAAGNVKAAIGRYQRLAEQFPNTAVGREAEARLLNLREAMKP